MPLAQPQPTSSRSSSPTFYDARKLDAVQKAWLWQLLQDDPTCPSRVVLQTAAGRHQLDRLRLADHAGEPLRAAGARQDAEVHLARQGISRDSVEDLRHILTRASQIKVARRGKSKLFPDTDQPLSGKVVGPAGLEPATRPL